MKESTKSMSVVVTRYNEDDTLVIRCLNSLVLQIHCSIEVLFLDQKESEHIANFCKKNSTESIRLVYHSIPAKSLSYARNYGIKIASFNIVAFCDSDCILSPNWAQELSETFALSEATIVGTKIIPLWESEPSWYHNSRLIREFYSVIDISEERQQISKVVGASFAVDKKKCGDDCFFDENLGRKDGVLLGGEETDLCERVIQKGGVVMYTPYTHAQHVIAPARIRISWIMKRVYFGGMSRAIRAGAIKPFNQKRELIDYVAILLVIPMYLCGYIIGRYKKWTK